MRIRVILAAILFGIGTFSATGGVVWINDAAPSYATVQAAVNAATVGDKLGLSTNVFAENVVVSNKQIWMVGGYSAEAPVWVGGASVIDGGGTANVMRFIDSDCRMDGIELRNGYDLTVGGGGAQLIRSYLLMDQCAAYSNRGNNGGALYVDNSSTLTLTNQSKVYANSAWVGGGIYVGEGHLYAYGEGTEVSGNRATNYGGGVCIYGGSGYFEHADVRANAVSDNTTSVGGGVYMSGGYVTLMGGAQLEGNTAGEGGGLCVSRGIVTMQAIVPIGQPGCFFNRAHRGGGFFAANTTLQFEGAWMHGNYAVIGGGGYATSCPIYTATGILASVEFSANTASNTGGGLYLLYATAILTDAILGREHTPNTAGNDGGGLYALNSTVRLNGGLFENNRAMDPRNGNGGGLSAEHCTLVITNGGYYSNAVFRGNQAGSLGGYGGGMMLYSNPVVTMHQVHFISNSATYGGGLYSALCDVRAYNLRAEHNLATTNGGALNIVDGSLLLQDAQLIANAATNQGGAGYFMNLSSADLVATQPLQSNVLRSVLLNNTAFEGGGLVLAASPTLISGTHVVSNRAQNGGGVLIRNLSSGQAVITNSWIEGNAAEFVGGGGVQVLRVGVPFVLADTELLRNAAPQGQGGGLVAVASHGVDIQAQARNCRWEGNHARDGGAFFGVQVSNQVTMSASPGRMLGFLSNTATNFGGAVCLSNTSLRAQGRVAFYDNYAGHSGGGLAMGGIGTLLLDEGPDGPPVFQSNRSWLQGGGAYLHSVDAVLDSAQFDANQTSGAGGGLWFGHGNVLRVNRARFLNNTAGTWGGGLWAQDMASLWMQQTNGPWASYTNYWPLWFGNNHAGAGGGAVALNGCEFALFQKFVATSNTCNTHHGGGLFLAFSRFELQDCLVAGNNAFNPLYADGLIAQDSTGTVYLCTIADNDETGLLSYLNSEVVVSSSILYGHSVTQMLATGVITANTSCVQNGYPGELILTNDPALYAGNYHLKYNSPCRNVGAAILFGRLDIDGEVRSGLTTDIGFDEFTDADNDWLPDIVETGTGVWREDTDMGSNPNDPHSDDDGIPDGEEWLAGTDPNDAQSRLAYESIRWAGSSNVFLQWRSGTQAELTLSYTRDLQSGTWSNLLIKNPPTLAIDSATLSVTGSPVYFRINARR